jgi:hypothetical protein
MIINIKISPFNHLLLSNQVMEAGPAIQDIVLDSLNLGFGTALEKTYNDH